MDLSTEEAVAGTSGLQEPALLSRKEKRKQFKKLRRKQIRQQVAEEEKLKDRDGLDDATEQERIQLEEQAEAERLAREKAEHDEQERLWIEREKKAMEDFEHQQEELRKQEEQRETQDPEEDGEYVDDDGPAEIIWKGNEIIVRKRRVKVPADRLVSEAVQNENQATSNPLPPQSTAFAAHSKYVPTPTVSEPTPAFGTEQDKTHCPFHFKTGVCRFGVRCSRVHVYPEHSFTLLMRNMYSGPGLVWENDEGLEHSDEEVAQHYEEFYEDVHSEFLQFGELVNFKVCNNASSHLRGNLYVHYKTEASAQTAYNALNGRFYAGKQITCEFVGITRWRVALCGEYMKGRYRLCSHGSACNFLHCFRNPRGEYDWADWDAPRPRFWVAKMAKLFGYESDVELGRDGDSHDDSRRRYRSPDSPQHRESRQRERRSRDRHHHSIRDDLDSSVRDRGHRKHENGGDHYRSSSDDPGRSSRHSSHRSRAAHRFSSSKELDERGRGNDWETNHGPLGSRSESVSRDYHELSDGGELQQKRHKSGSFDVQEEADNEFTRDRRASSSRLFQDTDNDRKYKRYLSRDFRGSDRRWSLDLRSNKRGSKTSDSVSPIHQTESSSEEVPLRDKNHEKGVDETRNYRRDRTADYSDSSDNSDSDRSHKRQRGSHHRHSERRPRRRKKTVTPELVIEREYKSPKIDDRWTGIMDS